MQFTQHAWDRWYLRFPHLIPHEEWEDALSRGMPKKTVNKLRRQFQLVKDHKYLCSRNGVVFVTDRQHVVITVIALDGQGNQSF